MSSQHDSTQRIGSRVVAVGLSAVVTVLPLQSQNGGSFKLIGAGGGTMYLVNDATFIDAATLPVVGYPIGATEVMTYQGAARFYLAAAGATMTIAIATSYSSQAGASVFGL